MNVTTTDFYALDPSEQDRRIRELAAEALPLWGMGDAELELIDHRENAVFRVDTRDGERYAFRIHRYGYHTSAALESELEWMRALAADGIDVPRVVPATSGELSATVESTAVPEPRQVDLFEWIEGEQLAVVATDLEDDEAIAGIYRTLGKLAAELHNQAVVWSLPAGFERHSWDVDGLTGEQPVWGRFWELNSLSAEARSLVVRARERARADLIAYGRSERTYSLIHADLLPENVLVQGDRVRIIDFDDAGFGWHLFELATVLTPHYGPELMERVMAPLVEGYRAGRELTDEDLESLPLFLLLRCLTNLGWISTRAETATALHSSREVIANVCDFAEAYLSG